VEYVDVTIYFFTYDIQLIVSSSQNILI
jgi:hypothetical protein